MTEIAIVVFVDKNRLQAVGIHGTIKSFALKISAQVKEFLFKRGFFRTGFGAKLFCYSKRKELEQPNNQIEIAGDIKLQVIKLPIPHERLAYFKCNYLEKVVNRNLGKNNIGLCYIPSFIKDQGYMGAFDKCPCNEKLLLKLLLGKVLNEVYSKKSRRIGDLDIVIIAGENVSEALTAVRLLESQIRYVTVAAADKQAAETAAESIFGDMGLSISIAGDCRSALKNADIIINFADKAFIPHRIRIPAGALVVNAGKDDISKVFPENTILNGLMLDLPKQDSLKFDKCISRYYSRKELAELAAASLMGLNADISYDYEASRRAENELGKYGFRITGFAGRHGALKIESL